MSNMLDAAAEQMMLHRDFQAALDSCDRGLQVVAAAGTEEARSGELKAGLCVVGIQALAELNRWDGVLPWVLRQYENRETLPAKVLQMCILLYSKVGQPALVQETARDWLHCPCNSGQSGFGTVAELYLLHVLLPLGETDEARELIAGEVGGAAFTEDQRLTALDVVEEDERRVREPPLDPDCRPDSEIAAQATSATGAAVHKLEAVLRFVYRKVFVSSPGSFPLRRIFLAAVLLYVLFIRMDPAHPAAFMWISKLLQLLKQMWNSTFAPYYNALSYRKEL